MRFILKPILSIFFLIHLFSSCIFDFKQKECIPDNDYIYSFMDNYSKKWGFKNSCNDVVIEAQFDKAKSFENDVAVVTQNGQQFFINSKGEIISEGFDKIEEFHAFDDEGFTTAKRAGKLFVLSKTGGSYATDAIRIDFREEEGYAILNKKGRKQAIFNLKTHQTGEDFDHISWLSETNFEGWTEGDDPKFNKYLLDQNGRKINNTGFDEFEVSTENTSLIKVGYRYRKNKKNGFGLLNKEGKELLKPKYQISIFNMGAVAFQENKNGAYNYLLIDNKGKIIISGKDEIGIGDNEIIRIANATTQKFAYYQLVGGKLKKLTKSFPYLRFYSVGTKSNFFSTLFRRYVGSGAGYYYHRGFDFKEGFARFINQQGKMGFINQKGELAIPLKFDKVYNFSLGKADVFIGDDLRTIDTLGNILKDRYKTVSDSSDVQ